MDTAEPQTTPGSTGAAIAPPPSHELYRDARLDLAGLIEGREREAAAVPIPACPDWTVRDLVAHVYEVCLKVTEMIQSPQGPPDGFIPPELDGPDGPLAKVGVPELLAGWQEAGPVLEALIGSGAYPRAPMLVMDLISHQIDLRLALGAPVPERHPAYPPSIGVVFRGFSAQVRRLGQAPVKLVASGQEYLIGDGEPAVTVRGSHLDALRSLTGRRTSAQISDALAWTDRPRPWLRAFAWGPFQPPAEPVEQVLNAI